MEAIFPLYPKLSRPGVLSASDDIGYWVLVDVYGYSGTTIDDGGGIDTAQPEIDDIGHPLLLRLASYAL